VIILDILIIDDHPLFIEGISNVLNRLGKSIEFSRATKTKDAIEIIKSGHDYDLIILDLTMPDMDGINFLRYFAKDDLCIPVVIVSAEQQIGMIKKCLDLGAMGFIPKSFLADEILSAIKAVLAGDFYIPDTIQKLIELSASEQHIKTLPEQAQKQGISKKQFEVLQLVADGYSNQQIADQLHRTEHTVKSHVAALLTILGARNRTECVDIARKRGLLGLTQNDNMS